MWTAPAPVFNVTLASAPHGRAGVFHTVRQMRALVESSKQDPEIHQRAVTVIFNTPQHDSAAEISALYAYVRDSVRYVRDAHGLESLSTPAMTLRRAVGDCDDQATALAALLEVVGYPTRFVLAQYASNDFEHVYLQVLLNGDWLSLDPTVRLNVGDTPGNPTKLWFERNL